MTKEVLVRVIISETRMKLLNYLTENGDSNRAELVKKLKIAWTTVYDNLKILEEKGLVRRYSERVVRGRPTVMWGLTKNE